MKSFSDLQVGSTLNTAKNKFGDADALINLSCLELATPPAIDRPYLVDVSDGLVLTPYLDRFKGYPAVKINFKRLKHKNYISWRSKSSAISKFAKSLGAETGKSVLLYSSEISITDKDGNTTTLPSTLFFGTEKEEEQGTEQGEE